MVVDDDPQVLIALARDLEKEYGNRFRILQAESGESALELMNQLKLRNEVVALFLVDQRLPQMTGVGFLQHTMNVFPDAKRVSFIFFVRCLYFLSLGFIRNP